MDRRERVARALCATEAIEVDGLAYCDACDHSYHGCFGWKEYLQRADAALAAAADAADTDTVRVPREPSEAMVEAGADIFCTASWRDDERDMIASIYRAMIAAADRDREREEG